MKAKFPFIALTFLAAVALAITALPGCNNPTTSKSPTSSRPPVLSPLPGSKPTPTYDPNAPPASFALSNLRAEPSPDDGANVYYFYVDVTNVGGQPGTYSAEYSIDRGEVQKESKKITVNPGQTKELELIGPREEINILGSAYDQEQIQDRNHIVGVGDLTVVITLAERFKLEVVSSSINAADGNITVSGEVKNIGNTQLDNVIAVADFRATDGRVLWVAKTSEAPVDYQPVKPGQTTPFKIVIPDDPNVVDYRIWFKDGAGQAVRARSAPAQS